VSTKLPAVRGKEVARIAQHMGLEFRRQRGSHAINVRPRDAARVVIPMHSGVDLKRKTLRGIINDLKITTEEFVKLL
jgi:predicted RNA binding protein YcfA (HicA-like mRNA interferase family)